MIPAADSPSGEPLLVVANEVSGTTTIYRIALSGTAVGLRAQVTPARSTSFTWETVLDASASTGDGLTYTWRSVDGKAAVLDAGSARVRAYLMSGIGDYTFEVTITDRAGNRASERAVVTYLGN